jgi:hypothetical protein
MKENAGLQKAKCHATGIPEPETGPKRFWWSRAGKKTAVKRFRRCSGPARDDSLSPEDHHNVVIFAQRVGDFIETIFVTRATDSSRLWYDEPDAVSNAIGYAKFYSRS